MDVELRPATPADIEACATIWVEARRAAHRGVIPDADLDRPVEDRLPEWRTVLTDRPGSTLLVATRGAEVVGFAWFGPRFPLEGGAALEEQAGQLYLLFVSPERWGTGVADALFDAAIEALARDFEVLTLWTLEENPRARRFYERHGWGADGARELHSFGDAYLPEVRYRAPRPSTR